MDPLPAQILVAHAGHWVFYALYAVPLAVVLASIVTSLRRGRRTQREATIRSPER